MKKTYEQFDKMLNIIEKLDSLIHDKVYLNYAEEDDEWIAKQLRVATEDLENVYRNLELEMK